jgi:hypothetical protein
MTCRKQLSAAFWATVMMVVALVGAFGAARAAAEEAPADIVLRNARNQVLVLHEGRWVELHEWLIAEQDLAFDPTWGASVSDTVFEKLVHGAAIDADEAREHVYDILHEKISRIEERYTLTALQKQKLYAAGKGDIARLFDRAEEARCRFQSHVVHNLPGLREAIQKMSSESVYLRPKLRNGPFGDESLFTKTLNTTLTEDQIAAFKKWLRDRPVVVTRSWELK